MKKMLAVGLLLLSVSFLQANERSEIREKIKAYSQENIIPQMNEWKSKIDNSISSEELTKLNELRTKARAMKTEMREKMKELHEQKANGEYVNRKMMRTQMRTMKKGMKEIGSELRDIIKNNIDLAEDLVDEAEDKREEWRDDIHEMVKEFRSAKCDSTKKEECNGEGPHGKGPNKDRKHHGRHGGDMPGMDKMPGRHGHPAARLFLWDGQIDEEFEQVVPMGVKTEELFDVNSYPNPFQEKATIEFELDKPQNVKVYVLDDSGQIIKTLINGERSGKVSIDFTPETESNGIYFYKIEGETINKTGKLVLVK